MAQSNSSVSETYDYLFIELADPRTNDWFLVRDPWPGLAIIGLYLSFCLSWGPRLMERREPFQMRKTLVVYNFLQILLSCYILYEGLDAAWLRYNWNCEPVDYSTSPEALRVARGVYVYFLAKMSELLETIFFVLRKKEKQISFLHLYHHTSIVVGSWYIVKYFPGGHGTFCGVLNGFVHAVMYTYYMIAALGPHYQKYLFWKKYITKLQLLQFGIGFVHQSQLLFYDCGYPRWMVLYILPNVIFFYYLFSDFYVKTYNNPVPKDGQKNSKHVSNEAMANGFEAEIVSSEKKMN